MKREYKGFYIESAGGGTGRSCNGYALYHVVTGALAGTEPSIKAARELIDEIHTDAAEYACYAGCDVRDLERRRGRYCYSRSKTATTVNEGDAQVTAVAPNLKTAMEDIIKKLEALGADYKTSLVARHALAESVNESDAQLIAAAPDLLEACKLALGAIEPGCKVTIDTLERAIAKAEGKKV